MTQITPHVGAFLCAVKGVNVKGILRFESTRTSSAAVPMSVYKDKAGGDNWLEKMEKLYTK